MLCLQPMVMLSHCLVMTPYLFSRPYQLLWIPNRHGDWLRCLVFHPPPQAKQQHGSEQVLNPLHVSFHGGGFLGGLAEYNAPFCAQLAQATGAVVVSATYRAAPRYPYPAAHEDTEDVLEWLWENAAEKLGADRNILTTSGLSAGANLALGVPAQWARRKGAKIWASVTAYSPVDLRIPPRQKPKPDSFPKVDPLGWCTDLFDAYVASTRPASVTDARLNPILAQLDDLPHDMLFIIPTLDILVEEQLSFVDRLRKDMDARKDGDRKVEARLFDKCLHGWLELPSFAIEEKTRTDAFNAMIKFIKEAHEKYKKYGT
ncbi:hypothetical protein VTN77DRAFT_592 [Rasamsonia byssochlamydoides]|uniref:uncharacterized protein n=1 Tax=Rasamsonia byssochlamydoides TaxID=89139 RepID=UPI0037447BF0